MINYAQVFLPTLERLSQLVNKQYGCEFKYLDFKTIKSIEYKPIYMTLCKGLRASYDEKIFFPIVLDQQLTGAVEIEVQSPLTERDLSRLDHTVRLILQSSLENVSRLDTIEVLEQQMKNYEEKQNVPLEVSTKVISLDDRRQALAFELEEKDDAFNFLETMSFPFLIEAQTTDDAFKMALEIHQMSGRRLFLPLEDLAPETFDSAQNLRDLGAATLYTTNIAKLSPKIQNTIVEYYQGERQKDDPQIIVGTVESYAELKLNKKLLPDLVNRLAVGYLFMRQSFSHYKSESIMEFFIDSLTGRADRQ